MNLNGYCEMPSGTYFICDLFKVIPEHWNQVLELALDGNQPIDGKLTLDNGISLVIFNVPEAMDVMTVYDKEGNSFEITTGSIGAIEVNDAWPQSIYSTEGITKTFQRDFLCFEKDGLVYIGDTIINTNIGD